MATVDTLLIMIPKQLSNELCWYSDDYIKNKCKKLSPHINVLKP